MLDYLERKGLEEEGLLRKCGSTTRVKTMADTVELMFNCGVFSLNNYMTSDKERKISDVASLLKQFLRCALYGINAAIETHVKTIIMRKVWVILPSHLDKSY